MHLHILHKIFLLSFLTSPLAIDGVAIQLSLTDCMTSWLESIGVSARKAQEVTQIFANEGIEESSLEGLTLDQLEMLEVSPMGTQFLIYNEAQKGINVCKFGGACHLTSSVYTCSCPIGSTGTFCETVMTCLPGFCLNDGTCSAGEEGLVECTCTADFSGKRCQNCVNFCSIEEIVEKELLQISTDLGAAQKVQLSLISEIKQLKEEIASSSAQSLLASLNGPKFFANWTTLGKNAIADLTYLRIGPREFLVVITEPSRVDIYEAFGSLFLLFQTLPTLSLPRHIEGFYFNGRHCIVVASSDISQDNDDGTSGGGGGGGVSELYCWSNTSQNFVKLQDITTRRAVYVSHVSLEGFDFLIFTCFSDKYNLETPSPVYVWSKSAKRFFLFQYLNLVGSVSSSIAQITPNHAFLSLHASYEKNGTRISNSVIYRWNGTYFDLVQSFDSDKAYLFAAGQCVFVVLSNSVHRFDSDTKLFHSHSALSISQQHPKSTFKHLTINTEHYLAAVYVNSADSDVDISPTDVIVVLRLDGLNFDPHQRILVPAQKDYELHTFEMKDERAVLALVGGVSPAVIYQWSTCLY